MGKFKKGDIVKLKNATGVIIAEETIFPRHKGEYWFKLEGWYPVALRMKEDELIPTDFGNIAPKED